MVDRIIHFSIHNKLLVGLFTLGLVVWGTWSAFRLPVDAVPDITNNQVQIITRCPSLAGQEVEQLVTYPIEQSIANLPRLVESRSISRFGLSVVTVVFSDDVDIYFARQLITERLKEAEAQIPPGSGTPELAPVSTGLGEIYQYIIHPKAGSEDKYSSADLRTMQDWIVARQLNGTPGVAEVNSFGGRLKQYEVAVSTERLRAMGVSIPDVFDAVERNNENTGGAYIDEKPNAYFIRGIGRVTSISDIENIVVKSNPNEIPILIKDVAKVQFGSAVRYGAVTYNGKVDAVGGVVMMLKGANSSEVTARVKEKMNTIQQSLPDDIVIEPYLDRTDLVRRAMTTVERNLVEGALIVIFVLVLFLGNLRAGLIVASAIPLSMLFALAMMHVFGVSANLMSLGAIDFGLIVDGAVIIVESTIHHLWQRSSQGRLTQREMDTEVYQSSSKIMTSAAFGMLIILIVYVPILTLYGIEGKMFKPMAQTVGFAIVGALILSLTYIPMMCSLVLPKHMPTSRSIATIILEFMQTRYAPLLKRCLKYRYWVVGASVCLFALSVFLFGRLGGEFIPTLQEGDYAFHCILPPGTSLSQSIETSMHASRIALTFPEVRMVVGKTGSAEVPTDPMPPEATDLMILLHPHEAWQHKRSYSDLADSLLSQLTTIPGVFFEKNQPIQMRFNELMTGVRQDVAVKIFGENLDTLLSYGGKVASLIKDVPGATDPMLENIDGLPQISIDINRQRVANYGLNIREVNRIVRTAFAGEAAGSVYENERRFDLVVRLDTAQRKSIDDVKNVLIPLPNGSQIPLTQVADVHFQVGPAQISREDGKRRIVIGFNVNGRDVQSVVDEIKTKLTASNKLPSGYFYSYGGTFENLQKATDRLLLAVPVSLFLIFLLLFATFRSFWQSALVFSAIPMAAIGGVVALVVRDLPFSISAGIGFIALFGVAVLNGIVLIGTFNQLNAAGEALDSLIHEGTRTRLRPVLMTAVVASFGFLPMAVSQGAGAEVQRPLATVVIGGLLSSTVLTLFVLPAIYYIARTYKMRPRKNVAALGLVLFVGTAAVNAQDSSKTLTLRDAVQIALTSSPTIKASQLNLRSANTKTESVFELPKTSVSIQYGQYNSINRDNALTISQSFPFPTYYSAKSALYDAEAKGAAVTLLSVTNDIRTEVREQYYKCVYLLRKQALLAELDSLFSAYSQAASVRHTSGETSLLERSLAQSKQGELHQLIEQCHTELAGSYVALTRVMSYQANFSLDHSDTLYAISLPDLNDTSVQRASPLVQAREQDVMLARMQRSVEQSQLMPELSLTYFNQSIIGPQSVGGNEVFFDGSKRFSGLSVGVLAPITFFNSASRLDAMDLTTQALQKSVDAAKTSIKSQIQIASGEYRFAQKKLLYYETQAIPNSAVVLSTAKAQFSAGDIGYMEYILAFQTATEIKLGYLQAQYSLNQAAIAIHYLLNR